MPSRCGHRIASTITWSALPLMRFRWRSRHTWFPCTSTFAELRMAIAALESHRSDCANRRARGTATKLPAPRNSNPIRSRFQRDCRKPSVEAANVLPSIVTRPLRDGDPPSTNCGGRRAGSPLENRGLLRPNMITDRSIETFRACRMNRTGPVPPSRGAAKFCVMVLSTSKNPAPHTGLPDTIQGLRSQPRRVTFERMPRESRAGGFATIATIECRAVDD